MLANVKIKRFVFYGSYADNAFEELFKEVGIAFELQEHPPTSIPYVT